jgi:hypothetical protein
MFNDKIKAILAKKAAALAKDKPNDFRKKKPKV